MTSPRATSGDVAVEPEWREKLVITVGKGGALPGNDDRAIQAGIDYVQRLGGGTVHLAAGTFHLRNAVHLASQVRLIGSGSDTVLGKEGMFKSPLVVDSDWYDQEVTLSDASGFRVGDGICLRAKNAHNGSAVVIKRTIIAKSGNRLKLDKGLRENLWLGSGAYAATLFPLITAEYAHEMAVEQLTLDGNRANNENLDGNYAGGIFMQDCRSVVIRNVTSQNNNGDGISWQICHDVLVEKCTSQGNAGLGLHPGSGFQRPVVRENRLIENDIGIFFCWGVKYGLAEANFVEGNRVGISVGHRDTDNLITKNQVEKSKAVGLLFRAERGKDFAGHRNRVVENTIANSGGTNGIAVDVEGETEDLMFQGNELRETREPAERTGFRFGSKTGKMTMKDNRIGGFAKPVLDLRAK